KQYVFIQTHDKAFKMIEVEIGNSENGFTEILNAESLKNETFVLKGAYNLLMSLKNIGEEE
ncbi:MAG: efflux transporter periplasmic adaptor subunit, partial [Chitinophagaceae bacterium]|nr:efflux transporter periplasmic adaptor subunit [Chitinophagaceae bacterium]